jgi:hypothetical protein
MQHETPILILGFNRPESLKKVFKSLAKFEPKNLLVAIDGPRTNSQADMEKVLASQNAISEINWNCNIETRFREKNLGIQFAVPDAVTWAIEKYGRAIVIEDDLLPGPQFYSYMSRALDKFQDDLDVGHISGYNLAPSQYISSPTNLFRKSKFPESFAWATWERSWKHYDGKVNFDSLSNQKFTSIEKKAWTLYFQMAEKNLISTWAFRWASTLWKHNLYCVSPNVNISTYVGFESGTHTFRKPRYSELKIESTEGLKAESLPDLDSLADNWISEKIFRSNFIGILDLYLSKGILYFLKKYRTSILNFRF